MPEAVSENLSKNEQERLQRLRDVRRRRVKKILIWLAVLTLLAAAFYGIVFWSKTSAENKPGEVIAELGRDHIPVGALRPEYNSNPPTSGSHYAVPADWGAYDSEVPDEQLVHNLEHGGIGIS